METSSYSAQQRRAINLVWTASGDYQFEPQFLALKSNGEPDFYMNCVIGLVHKWFGDKMPKRLFAYWAGDARQNVFDELCWLALENAAYEKELPERPVLTDLRRKHAEEFFASEYQLSRQEWMEKNQLVYAVQSDRWKTILGHRQRTPDKHSFRAERPGKPRPPVVEDPDPGCAGVDFCHAA